MVTMFGKSINMIKFMPMEKLKMNIKTNDMKVFFKL